MRTLNRLSILALCLAAALPAAHAANPTLEAYEQGIQDEARKTTALKIAALDMRVDLAGALADFVVTAKFDNPSDQMLEGRFSFELPEGAVVTGYALDIDGELLDGVLVDPLKARREYQERVRERIDPGVANVSRANLFSTTVYPIPAAGSRTIQLRFSAPVHAQRGLNIPLETQSAVGRFTLVARASALAAAPALTLPAGLDAQWRSTDAGFAASSQLAGKAMRGVLRIAPVRPRSPALATRHPNGVRFFQIIDAVPQVAAAASTGQRVRIYWDRSLSRRDDALDAERGLLEKFLAQARPAAVDLVVFNSSGARLRSVAPGEVGPALRQVLYRGATSFAVLEKLEAPEADICLVFSDGVVTMDARRDFKPGCQVFAISSAADADQGFLRRIAGPGGALFRLGSRPETEILAGLAGRGTRVLGVRDDSGRDLRFAALDAGPDGWAIVGEAPRTGAVSLRLRGADGRLIERRYAPVVHQSVFSGAGALWAADRVAALAAADDSYAALVKLSRKFSVASPALSFIVLENAADYVEADIVPPANYPAMAEYRELLAETEARNKRASAERLGEIIERWEQQKRWWDTRFEARRLEKSAGPAAMQRAPAAAAPAPPARSADQMADEIKEVVVTSVAAESLGGAGISVTLAEWNPDRPYLKALDAAAAGDVDRVLAREERKYGASPSFYFDVAEWLQRRKRGADALEMLLSALELPAANEETSSMVADRLLRYGRVDRAIWLYESAYRLSDYLPQPRRKLALALAQRADTRPALARADLARAMRLLNEIVMTPWEGSYDGIELIALMDANNLLPRLEALGVSEVPLDRRLRALLDVDLRVVIEWNTGATDMDLWVDEPGGERAIYSNPLTSIGGRLSNDMTQGFGPEEYLLRRAVPGEYRISVNVYASDRINPNGTTMITARLVRNFGRADQQEETMELELKPDEEGEKLIGTFTVR